MIQKEIISEALRIFTQRFRSYRRFDGTPKEIALQIVKACWNGSYFQVSCGNFPEFYIRDFSYAVEALLRLGYKEEVSQTLSYALRTFRAHNRITTTITRKEIPVAIFGIAPDSFALLLRSIRLSKNKILLEEYASFLQQQLASALSAIVDPSTGMMKRGIYVSSAKDHAVRDSSTYDNVMLAALQRETKALSLDTPFRSYNLKKEIIAKLWTGDYFQDDHTNTFVSGDANLYPYWLELFTSKKMLQSSIHAMETEGLTSPFPLKYTAKEHVQHCRFLSPQKYVVPNYEGDTIWAHHGLNYLWLLSNVDKKRFKKHYAQYANVIAAHRNLLEVYDANGKPYKTLFYKADAGLLWAAIFAAL